MSAASRVAAFGALLVAIFALAVVAGNAVGPATESATDEHDQTAHAPATAPAAAELRLVADDTTLRPGARERLRFAIVDEHGERVRDFAVEQGRRMHLIVVRRDLRRFQHLHPTRDATGVWSVPLTLPDAGVYQAFADFQTGGRRHALGVDLFAPGRFVPLPLPAPSATASADGYLVTFHAHEQVLHFEVSRDGAPVTDLQPYLGANGHLVMLRAGDMRYEHVHPLKTGGALEFATGAAAGTYRLFLQFSHAGRVHTVAFTHGVDA